MSSSHMGFTISSQPTLEPQQWQWQPTPVLLPGNSHGWRSLVGCSPWGRKESGTTERLHFHFLLSCIGEGNGNPLQHSCLEIPKDRGGCHLRGHTESDITEATQQADSFYWFIWHLATFVPGKQKYKSSFCLLLPVSLQIWSQLFALQFQFPNVNQLQTSVVIPECRNATLQLSISLKLKLSYGTILNINFIGSCVYSGKCLYFRIHIVDSCTNSSLYMYWYLCIDNDL